MIGAPTGCLPNGVAMLPTREPAFGDADLKTVYLGNLAGDQIPTFRSPIAGAEPLQ